jgi:hypothetical protein
MLGNEAPSFVGAKVKGDAIIADDINVPDGTVVRRDQAVRFGSTEAGAACVSI